MNNGVYKLWQCGHINFKFHVGGLQLFDLIGFMEAKSQSNLAKLARTQSKGKEYYTDEQIMETSKSLYRLRLIPLLFSLCPMLQW